MAVNLALHQVNNYEDFVAEGWRDGFNVSWDSLKDRWFQANSSLQSADNCLNNTAIVIRRSVDTYPQCGFKFLYKAIDQQLYWAFVFIDFGIVSGVIVHNFGNTYNSQGLIVSFNGTSTTIPMNGNQTNGQIQKMDARGGVSPGTLHRCQILSSGQFTIPVSGFADLTITTNEFWYWNANFTDGENARSFCSVEALNSYYDGTLSQPWTVNGNGGAASSQISASGRITPNITDIIISNSVRQGSSLYVSHNQVLSITPSECYYGFDQYSWSVGTATAQVTSAVSQDSRQLLCSYWGNYAQNVFSKVDLIIQNAPIAVQETQTYDSDSDTLTIRIPAYNNIGRNGYLYGVQLVDDDQNPYTIADLDFRQEDQSISLDCSGSTILYNQEDTGLTTSGALIINCYGAFGPDGTIGSTFSYDFGAPIQILNISYDCGTVKNYIPNQQAYSCCYTITLSRALEDNEGISYSINGTWEETSVAPGSSEYRLKLSSESIQDFSQVEFALFVDGEHILEKSVAVPLNEVQNIPSIQVNTVIGKPQLNALCDFVKTLVCENFGGMYSMAGLYSCISRLEQAVEDDKIIATGCYVDVIRVLRDIYESIGNLNYTYVDGTQTTPLKQAGVTILIPGDYLALIDSSDIDAQNVHKINNQETTYVSDKTAWVLDVSSIWQNQLIVANSVDQEDNKLQIDANLQKLIYYIVSELF